MLGDAFAQVFFEITGLFSARMSLRYPGPLLAPSRKTIPVVIVNEAENFGATVLRDFSSLSTLQSDGFFRTSALNPRKASKVKGPP